MSKPSRSTDVTRLSLSLILLATFFVVARADDARKVALSAGQSQVAPTAQTKGPPEPAKPREGQKILEGTDNDETLVGGDSDDWVFGKKGQDFMRGAGGRDTMDGGDGDDTLDGGPDADILDAGAGFDTVRGGDGDDTLDGGDDDDMLDGGAGNDDLDGGDGNDTLRGGNGDDILSGGDNDDVLNGGAGADRLSGNDGNDTLSGGAGNDVLLGGDTADTLAGEIGDDHLDGGQGADTLHGGPGNDTLLGSSGDDNLSGDLEHDTLAGGDGRDRLNGATGDDWLLGGRGADVVLAGGGNDIVVIRAGDVGPGESESIDAEDGEDLLVLNGFTLRNVPVRPGTTTMANPGSLSAFDLADPTTKGTYRIANIERIEHAHVLSQFGVDRDRPASLMLLNPAASATTARVAYFGGDGSAVTPAVRGGGDRPDGSISIAPFGSVTLELSTPGAAMSGSAHVFASAPLGVGLGTALPSLGPLTLGEAPLLDNVIVPVSEDPATAESTGITLFNSAVKANVKLTLYSRAGQELAGTSGADGVEIDVPAHGTRVVFVRELFPRLGRFQGTMTVEGGLDRPQEGVSMAVTGIQRSADGRTLASFPAVRPAAVSDTEPLHIAAFASGGSQDPSVLVLVNRSSDDPARGTLRFFDDRGTPWAIAVNGQPAATSVPYSVPVSGSAVFSTSATGPLVVGSARAVPTEGSVAAVVRSRGLRQGSFHAGPSEAFARFITAARRDASAGMTTEVALVSTGAAVSLRLTLRDASGAEVGGGTAQIALAANARVTRSLEEIFPNARTERFEGTLTVSAEGGTVAATVSVGAGAEAQVTLMPIVPLP